MDDFSSWAHYMPYILASWAVGFSVLFGLWLITKLRLVWLRKKLELAQGLQEAGELQEDVG